MWLMGVVWCAEKVHRSEENKVFCQNLLSPLGMRSRVRRDHSRKSATELWMKLENRYGGEE